MMSSCTTRFRLFTLAVNPFRAQSNRFHPLKKLQKAGQLDSLHFCAVLVLATLSD